MIREFKFNIGSWEWFDVRHNGQDGSIGSEVLDSILTFLDSNKLRTEDQLRILKEGKYTQEFREIIDTKLSLEGFRHRNICYNILSSRNGYQFIARFDGKVIIDGGEILQDGQSFTGQFHCVLPFLVFNSIHVNFRHTSIVNEIDHLLVVEGINNISNITGGDKTIVNKDT